MEQESTEKLRIFYNIRDRINLFIKIVILLVLLFCFLFAISLLGEGLKCLGEKVARTLVRATSNPFVGLFIGMFITSMIHSSSTTTSIIVGMTASGVLTIGNAIPIVLGANIGTTVTATMVSFGSITRPKEFERAFAAATMHDFFNLIGICIFFPLELLFHPLEKVAIFLTGILTGSGGGEFQSPINLVLEPLIGFVKTLLLSTFKFSQPIAGIVMLCLGLVLIFISLFFLVKHLQSLMATQIESSIDRIVGRSGIIGILVGFLITGLIQSSGVTISTLVPLVAAGIMSLETGFSIVCGANLGTTVTALLASLAGNPMGLTIALVHFCFNLGVILVVFPIPFIRRIPTILARRLAKVVAEKRIYAVIFVVIVFFLIPILAIVLDKIFL